MLEYTPKPVNPFVKVGLFLVVLLVIIGLIKGWDTAGLLFLLFGYLFFYAIVWLRQGIRNWKHKKWVLRFNAQEEKNRQERESYIKEKVKEMNVLLATAHSIEEMETALLILSQEKDEDVRNQLSQMFLDKLSLMEIQPRKILHPVAKGRMCYYTGHARQMQRRKIEGQMRIDSQSAEGITFFVFEKELEWISYGSHSKWLIANIVDMRMDYGSNILALTPRGENAVYFQGTNMPLLQYVITHLQAKQMQSW